MAVNLMGPFYQVTRKSQKESTVFYSPLSACIMGVESRTPNVVYFAAHVLYEFLVCKEICSILWADRHL